MVIRRNRAPLLRSLDAFVEFVVRFASPVQLLVAGFLSYVAIGLALVSLPAAQDRPVGWLDNLFNVTSAMSTTGLTTVSVSDSYTFFGELVLVCLFQLGGIGYMTITSFIVMARGKPLSETRSTILKTEFALPGGREIRHFVRDVVVFTLAIEAVGTAILYAEFAAAGVAEPLWSAIFHCVSAFATAGFSLNNNSLEDFSGNGFVCATVGALCYLGAIGFIVIQDAWATVRRRGHGLTFTSKVILSMTAMVFVVGTPVLFFLDDSLAQLPAGERFCAAAFQVMTASSTAGFNTVPMSALSSASLALVIIVMIIGASPSGTGGGIKTTTLSSLLATLTSVMRTRERVMFWGHEIPLVRIWTSVAAATLYLSCLALGVFLLCVSERQEFLKLAFEAASALGTVGLSLGITGELTAAGKLIVIWLMFIGRVGPVTIGLALFRPALRNRLIRKSDLAV